jgi:methylglutaconyl-CoA hydratase
MRYQTIDVQKTPAGIGLVWLNRPDLRNAFNDSVIAELTASFRELEADDAIRAIVLAGHGKAFCAGADLNWMRRMAGYSFEQNHADALGLANMLHTIHTTKKPTIARVHGPAFAGGVGLVAACDIAVAAHSAEFCLSEVKLGLVPATISPYVIAAMGERAAYRYMLTAEPFTAAEAYRTGLVQEIARDEELDETINAILGHIVLGAPGAHAATKELIRSVGRQPLTPDLIGDTATRIAAARASDEGKEGIRAFLDKRKPAWVPATGGGKKSTAKAAARPRKQP